MSDDSEPSEQAENPFQDVLETAEQAGWETAVEEHRDFLEWLGVDLDELARTDERREPEEAHDGDKKEEIIDLQQMVAEGKILIARKPEEDDTDDRKEVGADE